MKKYIRFGNIPENEVSGIWRIVLPFPLMKELGFDLYNLIGGTESGRLPMYLVQGDEVGKGSTNEPLLKNIRIINKLI